MEVKEKANEKFVEAFSKLFNDMDFEIFQLHGEHIAVIGDKYYRIMSDDELNLHVKDMLTDWDVCNIHIPRDMWVIVAEDIHHTQKFRNNIKKYLTDKEYEKVMDIYKKYEESYQVCGEGYFESLAIFWDLLDEECFDIYPWAVIAAAETYDFDEIVFELGELLVSYGEDLFCELTDGIFETIFLDEDENMCEDGYHIYSLHPETVKSLFE